MATLSIIKDPVTGQQFSRDTETPGSIYAAYTPPAAPAAAATPPAATAPAVAPIQRTIDPNADAADKYLGTFTQPETASQIAERLRQNSQGTIDSLNKVYDDQVAASRKTGDERVAMDNAVSVLSGLTGSTEANRTRNNVNTANDKEVAAVNNQRALELSKVYTKISSDAEQEALTQRQDATKSANDILTRRGATQAKALEDIKTMAAGGLVDFESFKNSPQNSKVYQYALDSVGGSEEALKGLFAVNRPKDQLVGTPTRVGDHFIQAYQNPLTGKISYDTVQVPGGLPVEYKNFQKIGDNIVAIPDNWDGDMRKLKTIYAASGVGVTAESTAAKERLNEALTLAQTLRSDNATGKHGAVGASFQKLMPFGQSLGLQPDRTAFEAKVNTLKSNLTLDNLKLLKGAMSDKDLLFLNSVGSSLDTNMSEKEFNSELDRVITKLQGSTGASGSTVIKAPDGTEVEIVD